MQHRSGETRMRILESSWRLFALNGYEATGVADICQEAGVSKGAFYHHFDSKQTVFLAILNGWLRDLEEKMKLAGLNAANVPEALGQMAGMTKDVFNASRGNYSIFLEFWIQAIRQPAVWESAISPYHRFLEWFTQIFQEGVCEKSLRKDLQPSTMSHIVMALAMGLLLQAFFDPEGENWDDIAQKGIQLILQAMVVNSIENSV